MQNIPHITNKQKEILIYLYRFRFLTTNQLQLLLKHNSPKRIQLWLKDLTDKKVLGRKYDRTSLQAIGTPAIYYLTPVARKILKAEKECDPKELERVYKERTQKDKFIQHCLQIADIYLFFLAHKKNDEEVHFFTKSMLRPFTYLPDPKPDGYILIKSNTNSRKYFLELFDEYLPPSVYRRRIKQYLKYGDDGIWQEKTNTDLPKYLLICPSYSRKTFVFNYTKSFIEKSFNEELNFFVTTKDKVKFGKDGNIWQKIV